jgi:hypothetical protein
VSDWVMAGGGGRHDNTIAAGTGSDYGVTVTTSATANTKGAYAQLTASLATAARGGFVWSVSSTTGVFDHGFDLAIGAAGSETIVVPDLFFPSSANVANDLWIPMQLPSGVRVAVRGQSKTGSKTSLHSVRPVALGWLPSEMPQRCETLGFTAGTTAAVSVTPSATANTKGSFATIGTTTIDWRYLIVNLGYLQGGARTASTGRLDVAVGAGNTVIIPDIRFLNTNTTQRPVMPWVVGPFPCSIPSGTAVSCAASASAASALAVGVTITGFGG